MTAAFLAGLAVPAFAQIEDIPEVDESMQDIGPGSGLFKVVRIELAMFGGLMGGDAFLQLPDILNEGLTFDTGATEILDFSGVTQPDLRAPLKYTEDGRVIGGTASFYLGPKFGMQLTGSWARATAVLTGHPRRDPQRFVADRSDMDLINVGGNIVYNPVKERKWFGIRPFINLGFGGLLNKFPDTEDVGALYFLYGGGLSYPVYRNFRLELSTNWKMFTFDTDEVARDEVVQFPAMTLGLAWRYDVPEEEELPEEAEMIEAGEQP